MTRLRFLIPVIVALSAFAATVEAQDGPLRIEITEGVVEPLPFAMPTFIAETPEAQDWAQRITEVVAADLTGTGLFRRIPRDAFVTDVTEFTPSVTYANWKAINAQALIKRIR